MAIKGPSHKNKLFILILMIFSVSLAGCISNYSESNNDSADNLLNYSINDSSENSNNSTIIENTTSSVKTTPYEKKGYCNYVVDGDTIDVVGVGRIRFVGVNTPERGEPGYQEAKDFVKSYCLGKTVYLDVDDKKNHDKYGRTLAIIYVGNVNLNALLLKKGLAEVMYIPPSEFNPYSWT